MIKTAPVTVLIEAAVETPFAQRATDAFGNVHVVLPPAAPMALCPAQAAHCRKCKRTMHDLGAQILLRPWSHTT